MKLVFVVCLLINAIGQCSEVDYQRFNTIEEVINFETSCISDISSHSFEKLSDAYASRGESLILAGRFDEALNDFQQAYDLALNVQDLDAANLLTFRALFDQAIVYGYLDMPNKIEAIKNLLADKIHAMKCLNDEREEIPVRRVHSSSHELKHKHEHHPFHDRDTISIRECIDWVDNTWDVCLLLISFASPRVESRLTHMINHLASDARQCCFNGGHLKGCFKKLGEKFHEWNQKWQLFGIPPDPNWK